MKAKSLLLPVALVLAVPAYPGVDVSLSAEIRLGRAAPPPPPEVVVVEEGGPAGPPPWAPAHGFRRNRHYYYYPGADVYYRPADHTWFYLDGGAWRVSVQLPASVRLDFDRSVALTMETDRPYEYHTHVRSYYPPDYFSRRVRLKELGRGPERSNHDSPRDNHDDHGRGKGKDKDRDR